MSEPVAGGPILLFDGLCNLCNAAVDLIISQDRARVFRFASLQSQGGQRLVGACGLAPASLTTMVLIEGGQCYTRSTAALRVARHLRGLWPMLYVLILIPRPLRDLLYRWIARYRYIWFGKRETCRLPTSEERPRFIE